MKNQTDASDDLYSTSENRLNTVLGDNKQYFLLLRKIRQEFLLENPDLTIKQFEEYVSARYGIVMKFDSDGNLLSEYSISNQERHLVALLKFM